MNVIWKILPLGIPKFSPEQNCRSPERSGDLARLMSIARRTSHSLGRSGSCSGKSFSLRRPR